MNPRKGFVLHPEAAAGIAGIWAFIAKDNPPAASRVREEILFTLRSLTAFPHQGRRRPDLTSRELRFKTTGEYLIAYAPDEDPMLVIAVIHGRRSPRTIAAMLREREP
jgi:plasmid stabilization system protein ParE